MSTYLQPADKEKLGVFNIRQVKKDKINASQQQTREWKSLMGFRPTSIWDIGHKANWKFSKTLQRLMPETIASNTYLTENLSDGISLIPKQESLSQFPLELARRIVSFWSDEGDKIYDPFSGMGERMQVASFLGRNYYGQDISVKFHQQKLNLLRQNLLTPFKGERHIQCCDSRRANFPNEFFDFSFTSPPYWDTELFAYGNEPEQLGRMPTYDLFLHELETVIQESIRVVKQNKFIVWVVADIRRKKRLIPFHSHIIKLFQDNGMELHDIILYECGTLSAAFVNRLKTEKRMGKTHEYILVFKKNQRRLLEPQP